MITRVPKHTSRRRRRGAFGVLLLVCLAAALLAPLGTGAAESAAPTTTDEIVDKFVLDEANILSPELELKLNRIGTSLEKAASGAEVAVLTVASLNDRDIAEYSTKRFRELGVGHKEKNNGVLLVVAPNDRKARIEVGYGLEGAIPDGKAGQILDDYAIPHFRQNDYAAGVEDAYVAIVREVTNEYGVTLNEDLSIQGVAEEESRSSLLTVCLVFGAFALVVGIILWVSTKGGKGWGTGGGGSSSGGFGGGSSGGGFGGGGSSGGGFGGGGGGFGGGSSGGGGASRGW